MRIWDRFGVGVRAFGPPQRRKEKCVSRAPVVEQLEPRCLLASNMPNIIVINTDDQRYDSVSFMPTVQSQLVPASAVFTNSFVPTPICSPSRASLLTGLYGYNHGVLHVTEPWGGFQNFNDSSTLATWLDSAGYNTGMFGKYINGYDLGAYANRNPNDVYVPPGWDEWRAMLGASFNSPKISIDGVTTSFPGQYSTDVLSDMAEDFIRDNTAADATPFFLYFAPHNPHAPSIVADRHQGVYDYIAPFRPPSFNEADISDKPQWVNNQLPLMTAADIAANDDFREDQLESMLSVDEGIAQMLAALNQTGQLQNTIIIYTSDNGQLWGEHRSDGKGPAWEESIRVPLLIYDGRNPASKTIDEMALNLDLAPTILQLAGVAPVQPMDGASLVPLMNNQQVAWRDEFLIEKYVGDGGKFYGIRTEQYTYVEYASNSSRELYDNINDPYQLVSQHNNPAFAAIKADLSARLAQLKSADTTGPVTSNLNHVVAGAGTFTLTATVSDSTTGNDEVRNAEFFVDSIGNTGTGRAMRVADGNYGGVSENMVAEITGLSPGQHTIYVHGRDLSGNWGPYVSIVVGGQPPPVDDSVVYRVNAGGPQIAGSPAWAVDTLASPSPRNNAASGGNSGVGVSTATINMTHPSIPAGTPMALFQDERYDKPGGANLLWDFPVTPGQYEVRLYFAETNTGPAVIGERLFDVTIEGALVLDNYDIVADVGKFKGVVKSFIVSSDGNLDVDMLRVVKNPTISAIEVRTTGQQQSSPLNASATSLDFGNVALGQTVTRQVTLTNGGQAGGASVTINPSQASTTPAGQSFTFSFSQPTSIVLAPGQSTVVTASYTPTASGTNNATLTIPHSGSNPALSVSLTGSSVAQSAVLYRVNVGGAAIAGTPTWTADTATSPSIYSNAATGGSGIGTSTQTINTTHPSVPAGTPMALFQTERFDKAGAPNLLWDFPVATGSYEVRLYFAEASSQAYAVGARMFDVTIEGALVLDNYDIFAEVGKLKGVVKSFIVTSDANLDIDFLRVALNPTVTAIEILSAGQGAGTLVASSFALAPVVSASVPSAQASLLAASPLAARVAEDRAVALAETARKHAFAALRLRTAAEQIGALTRTDAFAARLDWTPPPRATWSPIGDTLAKSVVKPFAPMNTLDAAFAELVPRQFAAFEK